MPSARGGAFNGSRGDCFSARTAGSRTVPADRPRSDQEGTSSSYISTGRADRPQGKDLVSIPVPSIDPIPTVSLRQEAAALGRAMGEESATGPIGQGEGNAGQGEAGDQPGKASISRGRGVPLESSPRSSARSSNCPTSSPRARTRVIRSAKGYTGIRPQYRPESPPHFKRTYKQALKRTDRGRAPTTQEPGHHPDPGHPLLPVLEEQRGALRPTPSSST